MRQLGWAVVLLSSILACAGCEPEDTPGGRLVEIHLALVGKNPGLDGRYVLLTGEKAALRATGHYDNGREENITLSLFWRAQPNAYARVDCQQDDLVGNRVVLEGISPGLLEVTAYTREEEDTSIPCSPIPDGGWEFPDAGSEWPLQSETLPVEVR